MSIIPPAERTQVHLASFTFFLYEILITLDDEINLIWTKPHRSWIKWEFIFMRYFALGVQISDQFIQFAIVEYRLVDSAALRKWFLCQVVVQSLLLSAVESVLMVRVYALYGQSIWIASVFCMIVLVEISATIISIATTLPGEDGFQYLGSSSLHTYIFLCITAVASQITILALTLIKYYNALQEGWSEVPIMTLMVRDGILVFLAISVSLLVTIIAIFLHSNFASMGYFWLFSIVSCAGCRMIINMERLLIPRADASSLNFEFTTVTPESLS